MRKIIQILLFIISYVPLYIILSIQNIDDIYLSENGLFVGFKQILYNNITSLIFLFFTIFTIFVYYILYRIVLKSATVNISVKKKIENNEEHLSYLTTYILPFVGLDFSTWQSIISSIVLFSVLGSIYIRTNLILTNPTLTFFGFLITKIETNNNKDIFLIHKKTITRNKDYNCIHLINNIYIHKS
jgi:hypothetical protein